MSIWSAQKSRSRLRRTGQVMQDRRHRKRDLCVTPPHSVERMSGSGDSLDQALHPAILGQVDVHERRVRGRPGMVLISPHSG